jgi:hypothetical protein
MHGVVKVDLSLNDGNDYTDSVAQFQYRHQVRFTTFSPRMGSETGGTAIQISGSNFYASSNIACKFGTISVQPATFINSTRIECISPQSIPGTVNLTITINGRKFYDVAEHLLSYTYNVRAFVAAVTPRNAISSGGTLITLQGGNYIFTSTLSCRVGTNVVYATYYNESTIQCVVPKGNVGTRMKVEISNNGFDYVSNEDVQILYIQRPAVTAVLPTHVVRGTTTTLTLLGTGFIPGHTLCQIGSWDVRTVDISPTRMNCILDEKTSFDESMVVVKVSTNTGIDYNSEAMTVNFINKAELISLYPKRASLAHTSMVFTIQGIGFVNSKHIKCIANDGTASSGSGTVGTIGTIEWLSSTLVRCALDLEDMQPGNALITIVSGTAVSNGMNVTLVPPPFIHRVVPSFASVHGGGIITLIGPNLVEGTSCLCHFGEQHIVAGTYINNTQVQCTAPRSVLPQLVNLSLSFDGGAFFTNTASFQYIKNPEVISLSPSGGSVQGNTKVSVKGNGFVLAHSGETASYKCRFGTTAIVDGELDIDTGIIYCTSPPMLTGNVHVDISLNGGTDFTDNAIVFEYNALVQFVSISPTNGPVNGNTMVVVRGSNFYNSAAMGCLFGSSKSVFANFINASAIECSAPAHIPSTVSIQVTMNGVDYVTSNTPSSSVYIYSLNPYVTTLSPTVAMNNGATVITLTGGNFIFSPDLSCVFDFNAVPATYHNSSSIECIVPKDYTQDGDDVQVQMTNNGHDFVTSGVAIHYVVAPTVFAITPSRISRTSPTTVVVSGNHFRKGSTSVLLSTTTDIAKCAVISVQEAHCTITPNAQTMTPDINSSTLEISTNGVDFSNNGVAIYFKSTMAITSLEPFSGPTMSPTLITVRGNHLSVTSKMFCQFNGHEGFVEQLAVAVTDGNVQCYTPKNRTGNTFVSLRDGTNNMTTNVLLFNFFGTSVITSLDPLSGPRAGGTEVRVLGSHFIFSTNLACQFGRKEVPATFISSSELRCVTPSRSNFTDTDLVETTIVSNEQPTSNSFLYSYSPMPFVSSVEETVNAVYSSDKKRVLLNGSGFIQNHTTCMVQGTSKEEAMFGDVISPYQMECSIPDDPTKTYLNADNNELLVSNNGQDYAQSALHFRFGIQAMVTNLSPRSGPIHGGTLVVVNGIDFLNAPDLSCRFGSKDVVAQLISSTMAQCVSPAGLAGDVRFTMSNNAQRFSQLHDVIFTYYNPIEITKIAPFGSPTEGRRAVRVFGNRFSSAELLACRFNHTVSVPATFINDKELICVVPNLWLSSQHDTVPISLSKNGYDFTDSTYYPTSTMTYHKSSSLTAIEPAYGPISGGTVVRISGTHFYNAATQTNTSNIIRCRFGTVQSAIVTYVDEGQIDCVVPAGLYAGNVKVMVSLNGLDYSENTLTFTYRRDIILSSVQPDIVAEQNLMGTNFRLVGANFVDTWRLKCNIANHFVVGVFVSSTEVRCRIPANVKIEVGKHLLSVSNNGENFLRQPVTFEVVPAFVISSFSPTYGTVRGGTVVSIFVSNIYRSAVSFCRFSGQLAQRVRARVGSTNSIQCVAPRAPEGVGTSDIEISINSINWERVTTNNTRFEYVKHPQMNTLAPFFGGYDGGTLAVITGTNLHPNINNSTKGAARCRFTSSISNFTATVVPSFVSNSQVSCTTPKLPTSLRFDGAQLNTGDVPVAIQFTSNGIDYYTSRSILFSYVPTPQIFSFRPQNGHERGGTHVVLTGLNLKESSDLMCKFGAPSKSVPAMFLSESSISCISPAHTPSNVNLMVTINGGADWFYGPGHFTFFTNLIVQAVRPSSGSTRGGTGVHLHGSGFQQTSLMKCRFGELLVQAIYVNKTTVFCETPPVSSPTTLAIELSGNGVDFFDTQFSFRFYTQVHLESLLPARVVTGMETNLSLIGKSFSSTDNSSMFCKFQITKKK